MTKCSKVYRAPSNRDCNSSRTTQNYYRDVFHCFNTTSAKISKLQICFLFCFYYLFLFATIVLSLYVYLSHFFSCYSLACTSPEN